MEKLTAVVVTLVVAYFGAIVGEDTLGWADLGTVLAVISMGLFIWFDIEDKIGKK